MTARFPSVSVVCESERARLSCTVHARACLCVRSALSNYFILLYGVVCKANTSALRRLLASKNTHCTTVCHMQQVSHPLVSLEVGFPGGTAQVAVMSLEHSASRTICPGFCPYFIYVMVHLVNTTLPATHLLITTC